MDTRTMRDGTNGRATGATGAAAAAAAAVLEAANERDGNGLRNQAAGLADRTSAIADDALPVVEQGLDRAQSLIDQAMTAVDDGIASMRAKADELTGQVEAYTRQQPINALLIAGFTGAALLGLLSLLARRR